jgi:hypothetical protein
VLLAMRFYPVDLGEQGCSLSGGILELRYPDTVFWSISVKILSKCSMKEDTVSHSLLLSPSAHSQKTLLVELRAWSWSVGGVRDKRCSKSR